MELGPFGITVNAVAPGITLTDRIQKFISVRSTEDLQNLINEIPLGRMSTAEDQARVIAFLASDEAAFVSGQTIEVTGKRIDHQDDPALRALLRCEYVS